MGIFDGIFGSNNADPAAPATPAPVPAQAATPAPADPGAIPANVDPNAAPATPVPPTPTPVEPTPDTPLAEFSKLWDTEPKKEGDTPTQPAPLNAEDLQKVMGKTNFAAGIDPNTMTAIAAGGEDAQKAFTTAMNQVAQQVMVQSTLVNNKLAEKAIKEALATQTAKLPDMLRSQQASDHLITSNPLFNNPAIKPVIEATQAQLLQKFPQATAAEITAMTQNFITTMGAAFAPKETVNSNSGSEVNWDAFLDPDNQ